MSKGQSLWSRLQVWVQKILNTTSKPHNNSYVKERISEQQAAEDLRKKVEPWGLPVLTQTPVETFRQSGSRLRDKIHTSPSAGAKHDSAFLLGLDNLTNLETLSNESFLKVISWSFENKQSSAIINTYPILDNLSDGNSLSTEDILKTAQWELEPVSSGKGISASFAPCFLLGLDNLPAVDNLLAKDLLNLINWEVDNQIILPIEAEDLSLLEDLLGNFPE
jgi:hypothetical protein